MVLMSKKSSVLNIAVWKGEDLHHVVLEMDRAVKKLLDKTSLWHVQHNL